MENIFILNPDANWLELIDAINERITKAKAMTSCLLANSASESQLPHESIYNVIWAINGYIDEADCLCTKLCKKGDCDKLSESH